MLSNRIHHFVSCLNRFPVRLDYNWQSEHKIMLARCWYVEISRKWSFYHVLSVLCNQKEMSSTHFRFCQVVKVRLHDDIFWTNSCVWSLDTIDIIVFSYIFYYVVFLDRRRHVGIVLEQIWKIHHRHRLSTSWWKFDYIFIVSNTCIYFVFNCIYQTHYIFLK